MTTTTQAPAPMETIVRLRRGTAPRSVAIALAVPLDAADPEAGSRAFDAFTRLIEAGRCRPAKVELQWASLDVHPERGVVVESWDALFPRLDPGAFAIFARMIQSSLPAVRALEIREHAPDVTLTVRRFDQDGEATIRDVPWKIAFVPAEAPAVRILFAEPAGADDVHQVNRAVRTWADVLALGGFPGGRGHLGSTGTLVSAEATGEREILLRLCGVACGYDAWEALFEVLAEAEVKTPIERVEIQGSV